MPPLAEEPGHLRDREPIEIELKLAVNDDKAVRELLMNPPRDGLAGFRAAGDVRSIEVVDRYFDTARFGGRFERAGFRARLRTVDRSTLLTVKSSAAIEGSVARRQEFEGPATPAFDPSSWPDSAARARVVAVVGDDPIVEIGALRQRRLQRNFERAGTTIEVSLDEVVVLRDGLEELEGPQRTEVEAELLAGDPDALVEIEQVLRALPGTDDPLGSKFDFARQPVRVLVLCIGNSCRSQMAEAFLTRAGGGSVAVSSAGTRPSVVNPLTIEVLAERGFDWSMARSKPMSALLDQAFDVVVTVCDEAAEACPVFPGGGRRVHAPFDDPATISGTREQSLAGYRRVRDEIETWAKEFVARELGPVTN